jgi:hypothetical protein
MLVVLLDSGFNGMPGSSNVDLITFLMDAVNPSHFQAKVILNG